MPSQESIRALRALLLPVSVSVDTEARCGQCLEEILLKYGVLVDDFHNWIALELDNWEAVDSPSSELRNVIEKVLLVSGTIREKMLSKRYFDIHTKLCGDFFLSHSESRWFLSHSSLIMDLAICEKLTAAQISRMLAVRDTRASFSRQTVAAFLEKMQCAPTLEVTQVNELFETDSIQEAGYFADASLGESSAMVNAVARSLGYGGDIARCLNQLATDDVLDNYIPYLQILHFQCTLAEFFDHAVTDLYEFSPRGKAAGWLFNAYPESLNRAGNPYLNNAKSVERADPAWVRSKKKNGRLGASALEEILRTLEMMGFAARRELARLIRLWLHRTMRFAEPLLCVLPPSFTPQQWDNFLNTLALGNTSTYGILEQRVVDAFSGGVHTGNWRSRGIGASVNATNLSSMRLGDCDYQSSDLREIFAYESHGGVLTDIYVEEHLRTLNKSFYLRKNELEGIAELDEWIINVIFIAHEVKVKKYENNTRFFLDGAVFILTFKTFHEFKNDWLESQPDYNELNRLVLSPLRDRRTPNEVRRTLLELVQ